MDSCLYDLKEYECGLRMDELSVKCLLYADDQVILAPSVCELQEMALFSPLVRYTFPQTLLQTERPCALGAGAVR
ncbi:hypothetical protein EVAR_38953_1 [Eumeta japonica]|uniref:Reverse transcriptase domain-containing protein n=1 Tax=Eumeta variegata TaxID=151549 RepID=A0A4C1WA09_EUMVA|nr:hypothetical protein EVAR_38953_1 [Eumeta japonica]